MAFNRIVWRMYSTEVIKWLEPKPTLSVDAKRVTLMIVYYDGAPKPAEVMPSARKAPPIVVFRCGDLVASEVMRRAVEVAEAAGFDVVPSIRVAHDLRTAADLYDADHWHRIACAMAASESCDLRRWVLDVETYSIPGGVKAADNPESIVGDAFCAFDDVMNASGGFYPVDPAALLFREMAPAAHDDFGFYHEGDTFPLAVEALGSTAAANRLKLAHHDDVMKAERAWLEFGGRQPKSLPGFYDTLLRTPGALIEAASDELRSDVAWVFHRHWRTAETGEADLLATLTDDPAWRAMTLLDDLNRGLVLHCRRPGWDPCWPEVDGPTFSRWTSVLVDGAEQDVPVGHSPVEWREHETHTAFSADPGARHWLRVDLPSQRWSTAMTTTIAVDVRVEASAALDVSPLVGLWDGDGGWQSWLLLPQELRPVDAEMRSLLLEDGWQRVIISWPADVVTPGRSRIECNRATTTGKLTQNPGGFDMRNLSIWNRALSDDEKARIFDDAEWPWGVR